jgi:hypothetical protein
MQKQLCNRIKIKARLLELVPAIEAHQDFDVRTFNLKVV